MPLNGPYRPLNPTVEDVRDEMDDTNDGIPSQPQFSWPEIYLQHESVLCSHLRMLHHLKGSIASDAEASRVVSSMLDRANKLFLQFEGIKKHIIPREFIGTTKTAFPADVRSVPGDSQGFHSHAPSPRHDDSATRTKQRKKRQRLSKDNTDQEAELEEPLLAGIQRLQKRKRVDLAIPGANEDVCDAIPVPLETEDISEEVQRRLKIKEEQRRKRDTKAEKRKRERDSLGSNGSTSSPLTIAKPRKKFKISEQVNR